MFFKSIKFIGASLTWIVLSIILPGWFHWNIICMGNSQMDL